MVEIPLKLMIRTREKVMFEGEVDSISSKNRKGAFDVMPLHGNFISLISDTITVRTKDGRNQEFPVADGVVRVYKNEIQIYLGIKLTKK